MRRKPKRFFLKEKEARLVVDSVSRKLGIDLGQILSYKSGIELVKTQFTDIFLIGGRPLLFRDKGDILPTLFFDEILKLMPKLIVDMGAVPFICNGADVMAPGVVGVRGSFEKEGVLVIIDERHGKTIALGQATSDVHQIPNVKKGVVATTIHFVGDKMWNLGKKLEQTQ